MRILVIDDEKNIRRTMAMALESMEHEVVCAASGAEACRRRLLVPLIAGGEI